MSRGLIDHHWSIVYHINMLKLSSPGTRKSILDFLRFVSLRFSARDDFLDLVPWLVDFPRVRISYVPRQGSRQWFLPVVKSTSHGTRKSIFAFFRFVNLRFSDRLVFWVLSRGLYAMSWPLARDMRFSEIWNHQASRQKIRFSIFSESRVRHFPTHLCFESCPAAWCPWLYQASGHWYLNQKK